MPQTSINCIAACGDNRALGKDNKLLWRLPADMKRFREITRGYPVIMGRKTYESIGRALPNRLNIVISRNPDFKAEGVILMDSLQDALTYAKRTGPQSVFIIGGAQVYKEALALCNKLYITEVHESPDADAYFPSYSSFGRVIYEQDILDNGIQTTFKILEKSPY